MSDKHHAADPSPEPERTKDKPANIAPDAVKDPNEKTEGKPGMSPGGDPKPGGKKPGGDADPGGG